MSKASIILQHLYSLCQNDSHNEIEDYLSFQIEKLANYDLWETIDNILYTADLDKLHAHAAICLINMTYEFKNKLAMRTSFIDSAKLNFPNRINGYE